MALKEKGRPAGGDPIPNSVRQDNPDFISQPPLILQQVARLTRRFAISFAMAATLAPMVHGETER
jgi:hypothetical protein